MQICWCGHALLEADGVISIAQFLLTVVGRNSSDQSQLFHRHLHRNTEVYIIRQGIRQDLD